MHAHFAFAAQAQTGAVVHTGRNADGKFPNGFHNTFALALGAGLGNGESASVAGGAGLHELHEALTDGHLTGAAALLAGFAGRALGRAGAVAFGAGDVTGQLDVLFRTLGGLAEGDGHVVAQIIALLGTGAAGTGAAEAEQITEHVAELCEDVFGTVEGGAAHTRIGGTEPVVVGAPFRIAENVVGFRSFLELLFGLGIVRIVIGMILERQLSVGALDLVLGSVSGDAKNFVIVARAHEIFP